MNKESVSKWLEEGKGVLGIELGSTRIKAVLIDKNHEPVATGSFDWENRLENNLWTYDLKDVWTGVQGAYASLAEDVYNKYDVKLTSLAAIGVSAMMHGYLVFNKNEELLTPFRTWRNTNTEKAAKELTKRFNFNIPHRWSVAHLYQAILDNEPHVKDIAYMTTLAGYVHWKLTGEKVLGIGDASGMFPINGEQYDEKMLAIFDTLTSNYPWKLSNLLPEVMLSGDDAGSLTEAGARLLDPSGLLKPGIPLSPPEGDAGTGMAATNSVAAGTGNVSAGTSIFAMVVLEKQLSHMYPEIDMVTTPDGKPVAMVHCNNCTSDINAWADVFGGFAKAAGIKLDKGDIFKSMFTSAMKGEKDAAGIVNVNYLSGEPITGMSEGRPMMVRLPDAKMQFSNFARSLIFGAIATLRLGMDILAKEQVSLHVLLGHGGFFKTPGTSQNLMAAALNVPVSVMETAGEGGAWGIALLAAYRIYHRDGESLPEYLEKVFSKENISTVSPDPADVEGFECFLERFNASLPAEKAAVEYLVDEEKL